MRKLLAALALCTSCGGDPEVSIEDRYLELFAVPNRVTLLGEAHGRTITVFGRTKEDTVEVAGAQATMQHADLLRLDGARVRALRAGTTSIHFTHGTKSIAVELDIGERPAPFANQILEQTRGEGDGFGRDRLPELVFGPPRGVGPNQGSTDTLSLGLGGSITLGFAPYHLYDGPGADFIVFENAFKVAGGEETFAEPASVAVRSAPDTWDALACDTTGWPYAGCAGVEPVLAGPARPEVDPTDPQTAGGDLFDLGALGESAIDAVELTDARTGTITGNNSGFDLDALALIHVVPIETRALEFASDAPRALLPGKVAPVPRVDVLLENNERIYGADVLLEPRGALELLEGGTLMRATASGPASLIARAGPHSITITFDTELIE